MPGVRPSEMRAILAEMGNPTPHPTVREIDRFIIRKAHEQEAAERDLLTAYRSAAGNPDAKLPKCDCGQMVMGCPACYAPYCPSCEQRHVFDCGRRWEQQARELKAAQELPPLHVDSLLIGSMYKPQPPPGPGSATRAE
jgi:hypothetical protein